MGETDGARLLQRVDAALSAAELIYAEFASRRLIELKKTGGDPVTEVDLAIDRALESSLRRDGEGWLSEETADDPDRLGRDLVWIVDPLDGTREFLDGLPEFCTSVAAVRHGVPVAGGVLNPAARMRIVGAVGLGVSCNGYPITPKPLEAEIHAVLASRSEVGRGRWETVGAAGIEVRPMGSVAYKLARVAAGLDPATWTPVPKHEWDVAGGAALLAAAGGSVVDLEGRPVVFNQPHPWLSGVIAVPPGGEALLPRIRELVATQLRHNE